MSHGHAVNAGRICDFNHAMPVAGRDAPFAPAPHSPGLLTQSAGQFHVAAEAVDYQGSVHIPHNRHYGEFGKHKTAIASKKPACENRQMKQPKSTALLAKVAERLRAARMAYHPNAAEFARALGIDPRVLHKYEKGTTYPDELFIVRFADLIGCPTDWVYRGLITEEMPVMLAAGIAAAAPHLIAEAKGQAAAARKNRVEAL